MAICSRPGGGRTRIIAEIDKRDSADPVIVGGDFNAYSGLGPQDVRGAMAEVTALRDRFIDPLTLLKVPDADLCGGRIDYISSPGTCRPRTSRTAPLIPPAIIVEIDHEVACGLADPGGGRVRRDAQDADPTAGVLTGHDGPPHLTNVGGPL